MKKTLLLLTIAALCLFTLPAMADTFYVTDPILGGNTLTFDLGSNPTPNSFNLGTNFTINNISTNLGMDNVTFWSLAGGGLITDSSFGLNIFGGQLYSGSESNPTFILGSYDGSQGGGTINSNVTVATPEPGSLFLLGSGLVGLGGAIRRKIRL